MVQKTKCRENAFVNGLQYAVLSVAKAMVGHEFLIGASGEIYS